jgi:putative spermidine/putrescine transport system substrate-binding protein
MSGLTRRSFAAALASGGLVYNAKRLRAQSSQRFDGVTLRIGVFGGSWRDAIQATVGTKLEAQGLKIEYVAGNPADNFAKVVAARGAAVPIDVMEVDPATRIAMTRNNFLDELPGALLPNLKKTSVSIVEGKSVPYHMVQNCIVYRADRFEADKTPIPNTLTDLQNPVYAQHLSFPDVVNPQHWPAVTLLARANGGSESDPEPGFAAAKGMNPLYYYAAAVELAQKMSMGDVTVAPWHAGMAVRLTTAGQKVGVVHPTLGDKRGEVEYNYLGIVKGTKNKEAAGAFINQFLDTQSQADFAKPMGVAPVNVEARHQLSTDPVMSRFMLLSEADLAKTYTMDWSKVNVEKWRASWLRTING